MGAVFQACCKSDPKNKKPKMNEEEMKNALKKLEEMVHGK